MTPMILQEVFDNALFGIRQQGYRRSVNVNGCAYVGGELHCAIGHSFVKAGIDGALLDKVMVCTGVQSLLELRNFDVDATKSQQQAAKVELGKVGAIFQGLETQALSDLQSVHDDVLMDSEDSGRDFEVAMRSFAYENGLTYTPLSN